MVKSLLAAAAACGALALGACGQTSTVEAQPSSAAEPATAPASATHQDDGVLENAGEVIDGAGDHVEDSINDATDDNPNTNP